MQPLFGVNLRSKLFEQLDRQLLSELETEIRSTVNQYEKRITIRTLDVWEDKRIGEVQYNRIRIVLTYVLFAAPFYIETLEIIV